jgi:hypothetical protein
MLTADVAARLESATVALNQVLYAEAVGLPVAAGAYDAPTAALADLYAGLVATQDPLLRAFAVEARAEARRVAADTAVSAAQDQWLVEPALRVGDSPLTWRNWKAFERAADDGDRLQAGFEALVARSAQVQPALQARAANQQADFGAHALTPVDVFALRENLTPAALRSLLVRVGQACRAPFRTALDALSRSVFGRSAGPAELRALYLNRMYEPAAPLFSAVGAVARAQAALARLGFDTSRVPVDVEDRPRKYPGAFCFPVSIPDDVRISVRQASAHHLVDMLYHELGHAVHFSGISADLPFVDRYWLSSGQHETFSTLFEHLLAEPLFLQQEFGFEGQPLAQLLDFSRFKALLTGAWLGASALTVLDAWRAALPWPEVEQCFAANMLAFTGIEMPPGFARLEPFTASLSIYPAGYVLALARVAHWLRRLRALGGEAWWQSPLARDDIRARLAAGGAVQFPASWNQPDALLADFVGSG